MKDWGRWGSRRSVSVSVACCFVVIALASCGGDSTNTETTVAVLDVSGSTSEFRNQYIAEIESDVLDDSFGSSGGRFLIITAQENSREYGTLREVEVPSKPGFWSNLFNGDRHYRSSHFEAKRAALVDVCELIGREPSEEQLEQHIKDGENSTVGVEDWCLRRHGGTPDHSTVPGCTCSSQEPTTCGSGGTDLLGAVERSAQELQHAEEGDRSLVIFSDLIHNDTERCLNFLDPSVDLDALLTSLQSEGRLPDLSGVRVYNSGGAINSGGLPQDRSQAILAFWSEYFEAAGAELPTPLGGQLNLASQSN